MFDPELDIVLEGASPQPPQGIQNNKEDDNCRDHHQQDNGDLPVVCSQVCFAHDIRVIGSDDVITSQA